MLSTPDLRLDLNSKDKTTVFAGVERYLGQLELGIANQDAGRPWGGFFVIDERQAEQFGKLFFPGVKLSDLYISGKLSPKLLLVQPNKRLSWQYHHRRAEIWRVIAGAVGVVTSNTDQEGSIRQLGTGDTIRLAQGERHRLVGLTGWGIVAEIWQHTDATSPSDENDIIRLQDDFGR
jgi:mannose-6-phosphate isomerase